MLTLHQIVSTYDSMAYATAKPMQPDAIPVVDVSALANNTGALDVAQALHAASQSLGFIYIKGHGISQKSIDNARSKAFEFFRLSDAKKASVLVSSSHRGWLKPGGAKMDDTAKTDLKESFIWGHEDNANNTTDTHPLRGENQWPTHTPGLRDAAMNYFNQAHNVAALLMQGFALGLNLDRDFFLQSANRPLSRASFVYYPAQPMESGEEQFGVAPHTDFGVLTVLCQDDTGGLQVQDINGEWIHAPPIEGTLVVNVADLLSRWTAGAYKSTPHRVVNTSGRERLSLVLAFDPNPETVIDANDIPGLTATEEPITCGDYLTWRFEKAFSYRKKEETLQ